MKTLKRMVSTLVDLILSLLEPQPRPLPIPVRNEDRRY